MDEEFEIRIGDEIRDEPTLMRPRLSRRNSTVWGDPEQDDVRIILRQSAYRQIHEHAISEPNREVGGVLLGTASRYEGITYVEVVAAIRAALTQAGAAHVTFTPETWSAISRQREVDFPDLVAVGWYHTHPRMGVFLSEDDRFLHRSFFGEPWQIALVVEPHKHHAKFFIWRDNTIAPASGFYELLDITKKSIINWRNLRRPVREAVSTWKWLTAGAIGILAATIFVCGFLYLQTASSLNHIRSQLAVVQDTVQAVSEKVDSIGVRMETATAEARQATATQAAAATATVQTSASEASTAAAQASRSAWSAEATATGSAEALLPTLQPELTARPQITPTLGSTHVVTRSQAVWPVPMLGQGISIKQGGRELREGADVLLGFPVEFAFSLQNAGTRPITVESLALWLERDNNPDRLILELDEPFGLSSEEGRDFTRKHIFAEPGRYTAFVMVWVDDRDVAVEVQASEGHQNRRTFAVVPR
ncbi:MAG TPA: Mov34/MPN/PAD-1 family protein [Anaerolineae bacterium]|nr:Mov34/MPN/PAD-1 family protein [Anaerolineae bacterium]